MIYAGIDPIINSWIERHALKLCSEWAGEEARFCYVTGGPQECFQVSVGPPDQGKITLYARSVETIDDAELEKNWVVDAKELATALAAAWNQIKAWDRRDKGPATWAPPASWGTSA